MSSRDDKFLEEGFALVLSLSLSVCNEEPVNDTVVEAVVVAVANDDLESLSKSGIDVLEVALSSESLTLFVSPCRMTSSAFSMSFKSTPCQKVRQ